MLAVPIRLLFDLSLFFCLFVLGQKCQHLFGILTVQVGIEFCAFPPPARLVTTSLLFVQAQDYSFQNTIFRCVNTVTGHLAPRYGGHTLKI